jgi:hypothetical protein
VPSRASNRLQAQSNGKFNLRQGCHVVAQESSKIVPLGVPPFLNADGGLIHFAGFDSEVSYHSAYHIFAGLCFASANSRWKIEGRARRDLIGQFLDRARLNHRAALGGMAKLAGCLVSLEAGAHDAA